MQRPFDVDPELYPFESRFTEIDSIPIHYLDEGSGPVILFCHGNPTWSFLYAGIIRRLRDSFRCIAPDYPGFGMSGKPAESRYDYRPETHSVFLKKFINKVLPEGRFSVFVQDWGGPIGLSAACAFADRIEKLFIGNTWAWAFTPGAANAESAAKFSDKMGNDDMRDQIIEKNSFLNISMMLLVRGARKLYPEKSAAVKAAYLAPFADPESRIPTWVFPRSIIGSSEFLKVLERDFLRLLADKPAVLFWGEKDIVFPVVIREEWEKRLKNFRRVDYPEASHFFQEEEPENIAAEIRKEFT